MTKYNATGHVTADKKSKTTENWLFCAGKLLRNIIGVGRSAIRFSNLQTCWKFDQNAICYQVIENQQDPYCTTAWQYSLQNSTEKPARTEFVFTLSDVRLKKICLYFEIRCPWQQWKDLQVPQNKTTIWQQEINHELQRDGEGKLPKPTTCTAGKKACNLFWHVHPHKWIQIIHLLNSSASPSPTSNESSMECHNAVQWHWLYRRANMLKWSNSIKLEKNIFKTSLQTEHTCMAYECRYMYMYWTAINHNTAQPKCWELLHRQYEHCFTNVNVCVSKKVRKGSPFWPVTMFDIHFWNIPLWVCCPEQAEVNTQWSSK